MSVARIAILDFLFYLSTAAFYPYLQLVLRNNGFPHSEVGLILAIGEAASVVIPLVVANLADRTGKKRISVILCTLLSALLFIPVTKSSSVWITLAAMFFCRGLYSCLNPLLDAVATTCLDGDSGRYSIVRTVGTLGYVLACFFFGLSGAIQSDSNATVLRAFIVASAVLGVYCLTLPKIVDTQRISKRVAAGDTPVFKNHDDAQRPRYGAHYEKPLIIFIIATFFLKLGNSAVERLLSSYMTEVMNLGDSFINYIALGSVSEIFLMLIVGRLIQKRGKSPVLFVIIGGFAMIARQMIYALSSSLVAFIIAQLLHGLTFGALHIGSIMFIARNVPKENSSVAMSIYTCIGTSLPNLIGSLLGGAIIENIGYSFMFELYSGFALAGTIILLVSYRNLNVYPSMDKRAVSCIQKSSETSS